MYVMKTIRDALVGLVLFLVALFLVSCTTPSATAFDPNLSAVQAQLTAEAAQNQAQLYSAMATGTAQAPIVDITRTAAAFEIAEAYARSTSTAAAQTHMAALTVTAQIWTPTPNATMTAVFAQSYADATRVANEITLNNLAVERARDSNIWNARKEMIFLISLLLVALAAAYALIKRMSIVPQAVDERGRIVPVINVLEGTIVDIERSANGMVDMSKKFLAQLPAITAERQADVTTLAQKVDMSTRAKLPLSLLKKLDQLENPERPALPAPDEEQDPILIDYPLPEWNDWMQNWKPGFLALGVNGNGLLQIDPLRDSHLLFAGTTGSWKTRGGARVVITCALASGWQVIIAGKQLDYQVFGEHPNAHLVPFSFLKDPTKAIDLLRAVYAEIERRDKMMSRSNYGLWKDTGQTHTMVVIDEFSNLADACEDIDPARRKELWRWARMDTAEARKYGINMIYLLQDPTAQSIDLKIRRNTTPIMFRVKDYVSSRTLLNVSGAEMLADRHFLTKTIRLESAAAFAPTDDEIRQFLRAHPVQTADQPAWIDGVLVPDPALEDGKQDQISGPAQEPGEIAQSDSVSDWLHSLDDKSYRVIELHLAGGKSNTEIGRLVYGTSNGTISHNVRTVIEEYERRNKGTTTTTTTTPKMPDLGTVAA